MQQYKHLEITFYTWRSAVVLFAPCLTHTRAIPESSRVPDVHRITARIQLYLNVNKKL
jgi:hypothetical protein